MQLVKSISNPNHPFHKFGTGNITTLHDLPEQKNLHVREELLRFHSTYYSANVMKLVVLGQQSLDQLEQWVVEIFGLIPNKKLSVPSFVTSKPFEQDQLAKQMYVVSIKDSYLLDFMFPIVGVTERQHFRSKPLLYIAHLVGHEGKGSLLSYLKEKGNFLMKLIVYSNSRMGNGVIHRGKFQYNRAHQFGNSYCANSNWNGTYKRCCICSVSIFRFT